MFFREHATPGNRISPIIDSGKIKELFTVIDLEILFTEPHFWFTLFVSCPNIVRSL